MSILEIQRKQFLSTQVYNCAILHRRTDHIIELEEGLRTRALRVACSDANFEAGGASSRWSLLLEEGLNSAECPVSGTHNVTSLSLASQTQLCDLRGFNRLEIGCSSSEHVQFIRECSGRNLSSIDNGSHNSDLSDIQVYTNFFQISGVSISKLCHGGSLF